MRTTKLIGGTTISDDDPLQVWIPSGEAHLGQVGGSLDRIAVSFARPSNTTPYTGGDVVSNDATTTTPMTLANIARVDGGSGYIVGVLLSTNKKSITPRIRVHLFNAADVTIAADNAAWKEVYADASKRLGYFDLAAMTTGTDATNSDMSRSLALSARIPFVAAGGSRDLYAVLEALDAFTPSSGQGFTLTLLVDQN